MNKIRNNFLLAGDKFMRKMHLRQSEFTYSALLKTNNEYKNLKKQEIQNMFIKK